ncbi:MAG TPA: hypothetical protein VGW77_03610 [Candidatus Binatia bacterium]|jgi:hypothetical protein|nr:hypothetical protein [Candidatus Binatia bacterium]
MQRLLLVAGLTIEVTRPEFAPFEALESIGEQVAEDRSSGGPVTIPVRVERAEIAERDLDRATLGT